ncbi:Crp/Fnr family transcriptional regulator [Microscilla marina]|uniref:Putative cAMP-binding domain-containing regulatory protein n=1 Tax=Microscilla marina ATCC 23134 TaxID=313606 RepID=A1ZC91_MICM2|nr:cyclic nucleotide-binding domain-containing protein [Microscilla marina]EAY31893.1 putative cAMP-binding domain-containing regulatory protein [Microscilla marina ATCC 23134]
MHTIHLQALTHLRATIHQKVILSDEVWEDFAQGWTLVTPAKNEYLTKVGETERYLYFVEDGVQRGFHLVNGEEVCVAFSFDHSYSGIVDSFLTQTPAKYYLQAISNSVLLRLSYHDLQGLYDRHKSVERWGRLICEDILIGKANREVAILSYTAEERYRRLMTQSPRCIQLIPQKYLASYLRMTPETFSRLRKKVKDI